MAFEFLDHTADIGVRISGRSPEELISESLQAFYAILLDGEWRGRIEAREERTLDLEAPDGETIIVDLLNELIYRFDVERLLLPNVSIGEVSLESGKGRLRARLSGERFDPARHALATEIKAATFHRIEILEEGGGLSVEVIFDL